MVIRLAPPKRWGSASTYIPVFETKNLRSNAEKVLLDNRKIVLFGGLDGVTRFDDVWEYRMYDAVWTNQVSQSMAGLIPGYIDGLGELVALPFLGYKNTKVTGCDCGDVICDGEGPGSPKNRPWPDSDSFDWSFIFGGWDNANAYHGWGDNAFYKSEDDMRPITDRLSLGGGDGVAEGRIIVHHNPDLIEANFSGKDFLLDNGEAREPLGDPSYVHTFSEPDGDVVTEYNAYNGLVFTEFNFNADCDVILDASITLVFDVPTPADIDVDILAEVTTSSGQSSTNYVNFPPSSRLGGGFYNSSILPITIPAGTEEFTVNVATIVLEAFDLGGANKSLGFVIIGSAANAGNTAFLDNDASYLDITYSPSYKIDPYWELPTLYVTEHQGSPMSSRKSVDIAYDYTHDRMIFFGGIDGNDVFGDTHLGEVVFTGSYDPKDVRWTQVVTPESPVARYGHSMGV